MPTQRTDTLGQRTHRRDDLRLGRTEIDQVKTAGKDRRNLDQPIEDGVDGRSEYEQIDLIAA